MKRPNWRSLLLEALGRDEQMRNSLAATGELFVGYHPEMEAVHDANAALLAQVFEDIGWPSHKVVGEAASAAAKLILQHAIGHPALLRRGLDLLKESGEDAVAAARLADRIAVLEGREQTFGTQFDWDGEGLLSPAPIRDVTTLDERRALLGLPPLAEVTLRLRAEANAEGHRAPEELARRRVEMEEWRRRVGWVT